MDAPSVSCSSDLVSAVSLQERFLVQNVPADGNCFFHSLSGFINGDFAHTAFYRDGICKFIYLNWDQWSEKVILYHRCNLTRELYKFSMILNNGWATVCEIEAAAMLLQININVWLSLQGTSSNFIVSRFTPQNEPGSVTVDLLLKNGHFQILRNKMPMSDRVNTESFGEEQIAAPDQSSTVQQKIHISNSKPTERNRKRYFGSNLVFSPEAGRFKRLKNEKPADPTTSTSQTANVFTNSTQTEKNIRKPLVRRSCAKILSATNDPETLKSQCRQLGIPYENATENETQSQALGRKRRIMYRIKAQQKKLNLSLSQIPPAPPSSDNLSFDNALDAIRNFELNQMSYEIKNCNVCHETRIDCCSPSSNICRRCKSDKNSVIMFSDQNNMNPQKLPAELNGLSLVEQQLISRLSPCINIHMLSHGGLASSGHCVTFPQEVNEPAQIFPRLPEEIKIIRVRRQGMNNTSKEFRVRRFVIESALKWLKINNKAYNDIIISEDRLNKLPIDGEISGIETVEYKEGTVHSSDTGPAPEQILIDTESSDVNTNSSVLLPEPSVDLEKQVRDAVHEILGENEKVDIDKGKVTIPWPSRGNLPISEFCTKYFFTLSFPCLFPYATGDLYSNRPRTCSSLSDWADHLLWYEDGRFAHHPYFKFIVHNMIMRKRALENSSFIVKQKLGEDHLTISDLREQLQKGDLSVSKKILYFSGCLRGTSQYWNQRAKELRSLIQFKINEGSGLPSFFATGSCAEFHFKPLRNILTNYIRETSGSSPDLSNRTQLFEALQANTHIVAHYFDLRTQSYFKDVMGPIFGVNTYWYRQEFAKSRGMVHWHGLCWRSDKQPHELIHEAICEGLSDDRVAEKLSAWASTTLGMTASHPAGKDEFGEPRKDLWPPPEGSAPPPSEEDNPLVKLLMDVSETQQTLLQDYLLLTNRFNLHRCSDYCLTRNNNKNNTIQKVCRMEFPKSVRDTPGIVKDKNKCMRLEMPRDHPVMVQHSRFHTQGWRANGDISVILSKSGTQNPSVEDIIATEKYVTGYACKGNQPTGALSDLFEDLVNSADETTGATTKSLCTKLLMGTVKRDISAVEASYEISSLPLYRSSHQFQSVSLSGSRLLEKQGTTLTRSTALDKYLSRDPEHKVSFYNFICKQGKVPVIIGSSTQATWPLDEDYCRTMLLLHWPNWRKISDIKCEDMSWISVMENFLKTDLCPNFVKADIEKSKKPLMQSDEEEQCQLSSGEDDITQPEWMQLLKPCADYQDCVTDFNFDDGGPEYDWGQTSHQYPNNLGISFLENLLSDMENSPEEDLILPEVNLKSMNTDQQFAFNIILQTVFSCIETETVNPLRMIVSGTAGSGKSFLIKCVVKAVRLLFQYNKAVQVLCPTGSSANLIAGVTLHSFLKIPTNNKGKEMKKPDGAQGVALQKNLDGVKVLLVDERSLIGANTLGWMDFLCGCNASSHAEYSDADKSWGGIPVVVFLGDDVQLPPVLDCPVYRCTSKAPASLHGTLTWQGFSTAVHLHNIVRQNDDEQMLRETLMSLREYKLSPDQAKWLQQFQWNDLKQSHGSDLLQDMSCRGLFVFPTHDQEWEHNKTMLLEKNQQYPIAKISAVNKGPHSKSCPSDKAGGLLNTLYLCKDATVMLTVNICVKYGLFNGAPGRVIDIVYLDGRKPSDGLPDVVMVEFPSYTGPPFITQNPKVVPIIPVKRKVDCFCHSCTKEQVPLRLGWGTTLHKCQGMTVGLGETYRYIVIHPGTRSFESRNPGALFVALSRAKSTGQNGRPPDFAWNSSVLVNEDRLCHVVDTPTTRARSKEMERITTIVNDTRTKYASLYQNTDFVQKIVNLEHEFEE